MAFGYLGYRVVTAPVCAARFKMVASLRRYWRLLLPVGLLGLASCTTTITPPPRAALTQPTAVAVLDHGRHTSLVVELPGEAAMVRYAYGDWNWYALGQTGAGNAVSAIVGGNQAALGRQRMPGPLTPDGLRQAMRVGYEDVFFLQADAGKVRELVARLDAAFAANAATRLHNPAVDLEFVHYPETYSALGNNSNQRIAEWLTALGCTIDGSAVTASWRLASVPAP